jgi:single-strand DNA-binding protein
MISRNFVEIIGRLGRDPEFRAGTTAVCRLRVATSMRKKGGETETEWHSITLFGKTAEIAQQYLRKGSEVLVTGRLHTRQYEKDGVTRYATEIIGDTMQLGARPEDADRPTQRETPPSSPARRDTSNGSEGFADDNIPF